MLKSFFHGLKVPVKLYWDAPFTKIIEAQDTLGRLTIDYWQNYTIFRWYWWFLAFWAVFPLFIWWKFTDRKRFLEVSFFGTITSINAGILDATGVSLGLWIYPYKILPFLPAFFPIDYVIVPVIFMLIYQRYPAWKPFLIVSTTISAILSMILDPIMVWMNIYQPLQWQYLYSIPVFVFMVSFSKAVTSLVTRQDTRYGGRFDGQ